MSSIAEAERAKYDDMWAVDAYTKYSPGERLILTFMEMSGARRQDSVIDAGCGAGRGAVALREQGFDVRCCDLTGSALLPEAKDLPFREGALWEDLGQKTVDWVYCCDVLEHVPTAFTMLVIRRLLDVARKGVFLSICHIPDTYGIWIGRTLHETVQPFVWWRDNLATLGCVVEARDLLISGLYLVTPK